MKRTILFILAVALLAFPGVLAAQGKGGGQKGSQESSSQPKMTQGMKDNLASMEAMKKEMDKMKATGKLTPDQQKQMSQMMQEMDKIKKEMHAPKADLKQQVHLEQLQRMQEKLSLWKAQMQQKK